MVDWNQKNPTLQPPFDNWPKWALELDIEIADLIGDIGVLEQEETPEGLLKIETYEQVREIIRTMVNNV